MLRELGKRRSFEYKEVDVMAEGQKEWRELYEFDTPVVYRPCTNSKFYLRRAYIVAWSRFIFNESSTPIRSLT